MFPRNENRNDGTFRCSLGTKTERGYVRTGDLLCGSCWRWMLLVCPLFTHDSSDLKADVPNLAVKTKQRAHIFSYARFQHQLLVGKWFGGTCNALNWCQQLHTTPQHAMFTCVSLTSTDDPNPFQGSKKTQQLLRMSRTHLPAVKRTKKNTYRPQMRIDSGQNTQFGLLSVVGWTKKSTKRQEQANLSLLRGKGPARPRMRAEKTENFKCNPDHWEMDLTFENLPQNCRRKPEILT